jgi:hypothetical protein
MNNARKNILTALITQLGNIKTSNGYSNNVYEVNLGYEKYAGDSMIPTDKLICNIHSRDEKFEQPYEDNISHRSEFVIALEFQFQNTDTTQSITLKAEDIREDVIKFIQADSSVTEYLNIDNISEYERVELTDYIPVYDFDNNLCIAVILLKFFITLIK